MAAERALTTSFSSVSTNDYGIITKLFVESIVTTNGAIVTEKRRETRLETDAKGNLLETATSEFAESFTIGSAGKAETKRQTESEENLLSFLGFEFGGVFDSTNCVVISDEGPEKCLEVEPKKKLPGFEKYYLFVTPASGKVVRVRAVSDGVIPFDKDGGHYVLDALELRYGVRPRMASLRSPIYVFDISSDDHIIFSVSGYKGRNSALEAWSVPMEKMALKEFEVIKNETARKAGEVRKKLVEDTSVVF